MTIKCGYTSKGTLGGYMQSKGYSSLKSSIISRPWKLTRGCKIQAMSMLYGLQHFSCIWISNEMIGISISLQWKVYPVPIAVLHPV